MPRTSLQAPPRKRQHEEASSSRVLPPPPPLPKAPHPDVFSHVLQKSWTRAGAVVPAPAPATAAGAAEAGQVGERTACSACHHDVVLENLHSHRAGWRQGGYFWSDEDQQWQTSESQCSAHAYDVVKSVLFHGGRAKGASALAAAGRAR